MTNKHPRLRSHTRRRGSGRIVTYYMYDMRPEGKPDIGLGTDYQKAVEKWDELYNRKPRIVGTIEEAFADWEAKVLPTYESAETRKCYAKNLKKLRKVFGPATWDGVVLRDLRDYLTARKGKTQANREMSLLSLVWNWARVEGFTDLQWPAAGMSRAKWKNPEKARKFRPTDELFALVYAQADQVLKDCMDLASATGMRLTDCRTIVLPRGDILHLEASKTGKEADFDVSLSAVLPDLIARRRAIKASHLMLLSTPTGRPVSATMLRSRWDEARAKAVEAADEATAEMLRKFWLRDMRKLASDQTDTLEEAADLLQHDSKRLTATHYRSKVKMLKPVR